MTITNRSACDSILTELKVAHFVGFGGKGEFQLEIHYGNGKMDSVITAEDKDRCLFFHHGFYALPNEHFLLILKDAGVDISKLQRPVSN